MKHSILATALIALAASSATVHAAKIELKVENLAHEGGLWFTPVFFGFHDGSFDTFDPDNALAPASHSLEILAEEGMPGALASDIAGVAGSKFHTLARDTSETMPPGVLFAPGTSNSFVIELDAVSNRYLTYASMILPSNDAFFGNASPTAHDLFDINGHFNADFEIVIYGMNIWDAGTEENDGMGAPFSMIGGDSAASAVGPIAKHAGLGNFIGTTLGDGSTLEYAFGDYTEIARITARSVPDSSSSILLLSGLSLFGFYAAIQRRKRLAA